MPSPAAWTVTHRRIEEHVIPGRRLGRHVKIDSRAAFYPYRHDGREVAAQLWTRHIGILDQGDVGSCTGNAETGCLGTDPFWGTLAPAGKQLNGERTALALYSAAEDIDNDGPYPPNDNGSTGPSVCQAALNAGLIAGYTHATSVTAMAQALQAGPVIVGVDWYDSFDSPASDGTISISAGAQVRGGHEFVVRGVDPPAKMFRADNSWGVNWGVNGSMQFSYATMERLFAGQGDCTVSVPLSQPPPTPAGPDAALWAVAGPWCAVTRTREDLVTLKAALESWHAAKG
jgi:hypothetical protein